MKKKLLFIPLFGLLLAGCSFKDLMFWKKKDDEPSSRAMVVYSGGLNEFHIQNINESESQNWTYADIGQFEIETQSDKSLKVDYRKGSGFAYSSMFTTLEGPFADFTYVNIVAKGTPGKGISMRGYYPAKDNNEFNNIFGDDVSFSLDENYSTHTLKVRGTRKVFLDALSRLEIIPEIGMSGSDLKGTFYLKEVYFSKTIPEGSIWENPGVDSGSSVISVNGWRNESWTGYTLYNAGNNQTGVSYNRAADWAFIEHDLDIKDDDNAISFEFENKVIGTKHSISYIKFILRADFLRHVTPDDDPNTQYDYDEFYSGDIYTYQPSKEGEVEPDENNIVKLELHLQEAFDAIGNHHENGYRLVLLIESDPQNADDYRRSRNGELVIKKFELCHEEYTVEYYSQYGESTYTFENVEGIDKRVSWTDLRGNSYWPRVSRHIPGAEPSTVFTIRIKNNSLTNPIRVSIHAGMSNDPRSDSDNNNFYPLYNWNEPFSEEVIEAGVSHFYYTDGATETIAAGDTLVYEISVDSTHPGRTETDAINVIDLLLDNCYEEEEEVFRSGSVDISLEY